VATTPNAPAEHVVSRRIARLVTTLFLMPFLYSLAIRETISANAEVDQALAAGS
jgi:hypothetical protein